MTAKPLESVWVADDFPVAEDLLVEEVVVVAFTRVGSVAPHCLPEAQRLMHVASPLQAVWQSSTSIRQMKNGIVWEYLLTASESMQNKTGEERALTRLHWELGR